MSGDSSFDKLKKLGQRFLKPEAPKTNFKDQPLPSDVASDRRAGRRVLLPLEVRVKLGDEDPRKAKIRDVNLTGLAVEPAYDVKLRDRVSVGFDGYPEVCPAFALVGKVRRIVEAAEPGTTSAMGIEIDKDKTSAEAQKNYRRLVLHYVHHRPLLENVNTGYFEGRCNSCDWVGRVGKRKPQCSRCGARVVPLEEDA